MALNQIVRPDSSESNLPLLSPQPMNSSCKKRRQAQETGESSSEKLDFAIASYVRKDNAEKMMQICSFVKV